MNIKKSLKILSLVTLFNLVSISSVSANNNLIKNPGFELNSKSNITTPDSYQIKSANVYDWNTIENNDLIEIWRTGYNPPATGGGPYYSHSGNWFAEVNAIEPTTLYQVVDVEPGAVYKWGLWHAGRNGVDSMKTLINNEVMYPYINGEKQSDYVLSDNKAAKQNGWGYHTGYYNTPDTNTILHFQLEEVDSFGHMPGQGNFIDDIELYLIALKTTQTINYDDEKPENSTMCDIVDDINTYTCTYNKDSFSKTVGEHKVKVDILDSNNKVVGSVTSTVIVKANLSIKYVDTDGNTLKSFPTVTYNQQLSYNVSKPNGKLIFNGLEYEFDSVYKTSDNLDGIMDSNKNVIIVLKPVIYTIIEEYQTIDSDKLKDNNITNKYLNDDFTGNIININDYIIVGYKINDGDIIEGVPSIQDIYSDVKITYLYKKTVPLPNTGQSNKVVYTYLISSIILISSLLLCEVYRRKGIINEK